MSNETKWTPQPRTLEEAKVNNRILLAAGDMYEALAGVNAAHNRVLELEAEFSDPQKTRCALDIMDDLNAARERLAAAFLAAEPALARARGEG